MFKWLHHLLSPHCSHCAEELERSRVCSSCEVLKSQLEIANHEKEQLLDRLVNPPIKHEPEIDTSKIEPIKPRTIPWAIRKQMLEAEDKEKVRLEKQRLRELEEEIGING